MNEKINQFLVSILVISIVAFPVYGVCKLFSTFNDLFVGNEVLFECVNEKGTYKAVSFIRDAGATTSKSYQLSILKNNDKLENETGNVLITYSEFDVEWRGDTELIVRLRDKTKKIFKQLNEKNGIVILYE